RRRSCVQAEGDVQGIALWLREPLRKLEERRAQLLERGEREFHLTFHPAGSGDAISLSCLDRVLEQGGLADARLSMHHQDAAVSPTRSLEQPVEHRTLGFPSNHVLSRDPNLRRPL